MRIGTKTVLFLNVTCNIVPCRPLNIERRSVQLRSAASSSYYLAVGNLLFEWPVSHSAPPDVEMALHRSQNHTCPIKRRWERLGAGSKANSGRRGPARTPTMQERKDQRAGQQNT